MAKRIRRKCEKCGRKFEIQYLRRTYKKSSGATGNHKPQWLFECLNGCDNARPYWTGYGSGYKKYL